MTHNTIRRTTAAALAAAVLLAGVAACSDKTDDPNVTLTSTADPAFGGPDGAATAKTPDEQARAEALAKVNDFYAVVGKLDSDPALPIEQLGSVAGGPVFDGWNGDITLRRSMGVKGNGAVTIVSAEVTDTGVPVDAEGKALPEPAWMHVRACTDISTVTWTHPDGSPAYDVDRPQYVLAQLTVRNGDWPDSNGWRVTSDSASKYAPCDAP